MTEGPRGWAAPLHAAVLDLVGVVPGTTVLDLGCGAGEFARAATRRGAVVTGIDVDPDAVAAATSEVPGAVFAVGDAHDPPAGPFDVVAAVQLLAHVRNPLVLLRAAAVAGATVAVTVWGREEECDVRAFGEALALWLPPRRLPVGPPPVTEPARLRKLVAMAGLVEANLIEVVCLFDYPDVDALVEPLSASRIGRHAVAAAGEREVRKAVLARLERHRTADGGYRLENLFRVLVAHPSRGRACA